MLKQIKELHRQIEIAAIVSEKPGFYSEYEIAEKFNISPTTIRRDLNALRKTGADIHSRKGKLVTYFSLKDLNTLISSYYSLNSSVDIRNLKAIRNKFKERTLSIFVNILKAIRENREVQADYKHSPDAETVRKVISPLYLIPENKTFYLIAYDANDIKFFRIETIESIKILKTKQSKPAPSLTDIFRNSWGIYTGGEEMEVKLKFSRDMDGYVNYKFWMENQDIEYVKDGIILKMKVKLSYEFISWVMGWGNDMEVIAPVKLKNEIINRAKNIMKKYGLKQL